MKAVFLGPPGVGKGTQAVRVCKQLGIPQISTGEILRGAVANKTTVGLEAKSFMDKGLLVPDEVVIQIVKDRIEEDDCKNGFVFDGFPRTIAQAEALSEIVDLDVVVNIQLSDEELVGRLSGRRICEACGENTNIEFLGEDKEHCPKCGHVLSIRSDDQPESIKQRLMVYHKQTAPLIAYYEDKKLLRNVDSSIGLDNVTSAIMAVLE